MNGTTTIAEFREAVLDPAKRAHYRLAWLSTVDHKRIAVLYMLTALVFFRNRRHRSAVHAPAAGSS